jgi:uncharacterized small protein (DUF1192 family)
MARIVAGNCIALFPCPDLVPWGDPARALLTAAPRRSTLLRMEPDDALSRAADPLTLLVRQDLDPLSVAELEARVTALEAEIARVRIKITQVVNHKASADALFRR